MKAILLAAGVGSRISNEIGQIPKSLLKVKEKPIIVHTVELLQKNHIEVIVITGFKHQLIEDVLKDYQVKIYYNPFFRVTNSIGSLWYARNELNTHEILIANADVYYSQDMLDRIFQEKEEVFMLEDSSRAENGDYFFLSENGILKKYGKELQRDERNSEYVGLSCLRNEWVSRFRTQLCEMIEKEQYNLWWENVLYSLVDQYEIHTVDVKDCFWAEVDTVNDYQRVLDYAQKE